MAQTRKLRVFISSTYRDLKNERLAAFEAIDLIGFVPVDYQPLEGKDQSQLERIYHDIDICDIFLLIIGNRYGEIVPKEKKSYIHLEYEYALGKRMPIVAFTKNKKIFHNNISEDSRQLNQFQEIVSLNHSLILFDEIDGLKFSIVKSLIDYKQSNQFSFLQKSYNPTFQSDLLADSTISLPLLEFIYKYKDEVSLNERSLASSPIVKRHSVLIEINFSYYRGELYAKKWIRNAILNIIAKNNHGENIDEDEDDYSSSQSFIFADLTGESIFQLVQRDQEQDKDNIDFFLRGSHQAIRRIWPDFDVKALTHKSINTIKAYPARVSFNAGGQDITWAVVDSGIDSSHPHLSGNIYNNYSFHRDFSTNEDSNPFLDNTGHGTHVAGIIAGYQRAEPANSLKLYSKTRNNLSDTDNTVAYKIEETNYMSGMAPFCQLVSLKVLNDQNSGQSRSVIKALHHIQQINKFGRHLRIHGVNLSLGYEFLAEWYACGRSPLCKEVDQLVKSGVVVVVAAGNHGYGAIDSNSGIHQSGLAYSITDPGNSQLAITVGATHRDQPHTFGVSYFSSKGPTGDGRLKPDLVAPGERIISCATGEKINALKLPDGTPKMGIYVEDSGTSMAAPHVSGAIAAFLSIHREFIGKPEEVKQLFLKTATDLGRDRNFQGHGLIDLMRAIQAV